MTNKTKHLVGLSLNIAALVIEAFIIVSFFVLPTIIEADVTNDHTLLFYLTVIAILGSLVGIVSSLISFKTTKPINKTLSVIRSLSVTTSVFLVVFEITSILMIKTSDILSPLPFIVIAIALINIISNIWFEPSYKKNPLIGGLAAIFTLVYCASSFVFENFLNIPWDMTPFHLFGMGLISTIPTAAGFILTTFLIGILAVSFSNIGSKELINILPEEIEEVVYDTTNITFTASEELIEGPEDDNITESKEESIEITQADEDSEEEEEAQERKQAEIDKKNDYNDRPRIYHISKHASTGKWQVKLATGKKAIKLFDTQAEAIAFAKTLVLSQGGSIRIHSLKGKIRKE